MSGQIAHVLYYSPKSTGRRRGTSDLRMIIDRNSRSRNTQMRESTTAFTGVSIFAIPRTIR